MERPYLSYWEEPPGPASLLMKGIARKNAALMREKTVREQREAKELLADVRVILPDVAVEDVLCAGVSCQWIYAKEGCDHSKVVLYLHGGGWVMGSLRTAKAFGVYLAESTGCKVLVAQYRLSPEFPWPWALDDCFAVYQWLVTCGYRPGNIALFGDSAGGNLCLCLMNRLKMLGHPLPACTGLASPVTDVRESCAIIASGDDLIYAVHDGAERDIFSLYTGDNDRADPLISPICGHLEGLPPILIHSGGDEPISADNTAFGEKAYKQGVRVRVKLFRDMFHDFTVVGRTLRESRQSVLELSEFFRGYLGFAETEPPPRNPLEFLPVPERPESAPLEDRVLGA